MVTNPYPRVASRKAPKPFGDAGPRGRTMDSQFVEKVRGASASVFFPCYITAPYGPNEPLFSRTPPYLQGDPARAIEDRQMLADALVS